MSEREVDAEVETVQILWEEARTFGAKRAKQLLEHIGLDEEDFENGNAREVFTRLTQAIARGMAPTLKQGEDSLRELLTTSSILNPSLLSAHADTIRLGTVRRATMKFAKELVTAVRNKSLGVEQLVTLASSGSKHVQSKGDHWEHFTETVKRVERHVDEVAGGKKNPTVATGFTKIDKEIGGMPGTLVVVAAQPGVGKSAFIGSIIKFMVDRGEPSAIFSMEDSSEWLAFRYLAQVSGVHQFVLRNKKLNTRQWSDAGNSFHKLHGFNIWCDNREGLTAPQVLQASRYAIHKHGARCIFLDNMTAMHFETEDRRDLKFQEFLREARSLANETGVPFVVLSHVGKTNPDVYEMPKLSDCSETTAFGKLARLAFGLCLKKQSKEAREAGEPPRMTLAVLKNTNGIARVTFNLDLDPSSALLREESIRADAKQAEISL